MIPDKDERRSRFQRRKAKHHKDHNNGKNGWIAGNPRFSDVSTGWKPHQTRHHSKLVHREEIGVTINA